jgi:hypothetical protein
VQNELFDIGRLHQMSSMRVETLARYEPVTSFPGISLADIADFASLLEPKG